MFDPKKNAIQEKKPSRAVREIRAKFVGEVLRALRGVPAEQWDAVPAGVDNVVSFVRLNAAPEDARRVELTAATLKAIEAIDRGESIA